MTGPRLSIAGGIAALLAIALTACGGAAANHRPTIATTEAAMDPRTVRQSAVDLAASVKVMFPGDWKLGESDWDECDTKGHEGWVQYTLQVQRLRQDIGEPAEAAASRIQKAWRAKGIPATISVDRSESPADYYVTYPRFLTGAARDGLIMNLLASDVGFMDFSITTACVRGDVEALNNAEPDWQ